MEISKGNGVVTISNRKQARQRVLDLAAQADAREGIRQGIEEMKRGLGRPAREVFDQLRAEYGIPRRI